MECQMNMKETTMSTIDINYQQYCRRLESEIKKLSRFYISLLEGDEIYVDDAMIIMQKHGFVDSDGFWVEEDE